MKLAVAFLWSFLIFALTGFGGPLAAQKSDAVTSAEQKLHNIESNGQLAHPDPAPTIFTEGEINAYLASGAVDFPAGVQSVRLQGEPGVVTANTRVDFDRLKAGANSSNPLLAIFTGVHDVIVIAHAHGSGGKGFVQVDSVSLDGVQIPRFVLQLFVDKYLRPEYPQAGLDSEFALPDRIDTAVIASHTLTMMQK